MTKAGSGGRGSRVGSRECEAKRSRRSETDRSDQSDRSGRPDQPQRGVDSLSLDEMNFKGSPGVAGA